MGKLHLLRFSLDCTYLRTACTNPQAFGVRGLTPSSRTASAGFASWEVPVGTMPGGAVLGLRACARPGG